ncbi:MAG: sigma-54-dependent transcriptional regulator [Fidelibacterota bacterium]
MKILVVDDEKNIRATLRDILQDEGHQVLSAGTGERALAVLSRDRADLVILDVKLPGMDGIEVFRQIKQAHPGPDVVMISGHSGIETAVEAVKMGAYDFLEKPLSMAKVLTAARNISEKRKLLTRLSQGESAEQLRYRLVGRSPEMETLHELIGKVAPTNSKVLLRGESGTGKELVAHAIHRQSSRKDEPFIRFNSAAIPKELVESELFGHEKGAFTGADQRKPGKLEMADGGTLFLDEIGDMDLSAQAKVLRLIQEGTFERVGGNETIGIDVRMIAATHQDLERLIKEGSFREDLYYRLNVVPITVPPLRERQGDVEVLTEYFLEQFALEFNIPRKNLTPGAMARLKEYPFPGNVRELRNLVERWHILTASQRITEDEVTPLVAGSPGGEKPAGAETPLYRMGNFREARREFEIRYLTAQLEKYDWNISAVARQLGMHQPNLSRKLKELGIRRG